MTSHEFRPDNALGGNLGRPFEFEGIDIGLQVLVGSFGHSFGRSDISATLANDRWTAPADLREHARRYGEARGYFDGEVARLNRLEIAVYTDRFGAEHHRLRLEMMPTGYFDMLATNVALGPFTAAQAPLLEGRSGIPETQLSNMVGLDLSLITVDGYVPVFLRSPRMAALERCWQTSSGETLQIPIDLDTNGHPDVFKTAIRGLHEELGIVSEIISQLAVTAIVATPEYANIGVLMRGVVDCTGDELRSRLNRYVLSARDNWEYTSHRVIPIDDVGELAQILTAAGPGWTKQACASILFAHAERANGDVTPLADAIKAAGKVNLDPGPVRRDVVPLGLPPPMHNEPQLVDQERKPMDAESGGGERTKEMQGKRASGVAFISYVREDSKKVDRLEQDLRAGGIEVWRDVRNLWPGDDWKQEIREAIMHGSCAFIICFSNNSRARETTYQWEEITLAAEGFRTRPPDKKWIYPVRLDDGPMVDFDLGAGRRLSNLHRTDLFGPNRRINVQRLVAAIRRSLAA